MSCYHPVISQRYVDPETGEVHWFYNSHKSGFLADKSLGEVCIPCGKCIGCRLDYSRQWADRMLIEMDHSKTAVFVTLTYSNDFISEEEGTLAFTSWGIFPSLNKKHISKFMKDLRGRKEFLGREVRFYCCGEYGPTTKRPHYHLILYGVKLEDFVLPDQEPAGCNHLGQPYYDSDLIKDIWDNKGFISVSPVSWQTFAYVARYVQKKAYNDKDEAKWYGFQPEFSLMSLRPGIGGYYFTEHMVESNDLGELSIVPDLSDEFTRFDPFAAKNQVRSVRLPKYLEKKIESIDPVLYNERKELRMLFAESQRILELKKTDLPAIEYYEKKEQKKLLSSKRLLRKEF